MKTQLKRTGNEITLSITADENDLQPVVRAVYNRLRPGVKAAGFRSNKAPNHVIERELGAERIQAEVIDTLAEKCYRQAVEAEGLRPLAAPAATIKKFVPFTEAEIEYRLEVMPEIKLPDYKKIKKTATPVKVQDSEITAVLGSLRDRLAERSEIKRAAKAGDEVVLDFNGSKDGQPVAGAAAKDYPLLLGSKRFIPGFEEQLTGLKAGAEKTFTLTFPGDYGDKELAGQKVDFAIVVKKVNELKKPALDDEFAKRAGPFADLKSLKTDITNHLQAEKDQAAARQLENEVVNEVVKLTQTNLPGIMLEAERQRIEADFNRSLNERQISKENYLQRSNKSAADHEADISAEAEHRVKTALTITEVAHAENLQVTPEELEIRRQLIAGKYQDQKMQEELNKPENLRNIGNQLLAEKTVAKLVEYASSKKVSDEHAVS